MICFGTGQTAGAAGAYPGINLVDSVDISPGVFRAGKFFKATNHNVVNNPKVKKIIQDGRQHLLTTSTPTMLSPLNHLPLAMRDQ